MYIYALNGTKALWVIVDDRMARSPGIDVVVAEAVG
jgi:hypothetical protein